MSVKAPSERSNSFALLRLICRLGTLFEVYASITDIMPKLEIFEVEVKSTADFIERRQ